MAFSRSSKASIQKDLGVPLFLESLSKVILGACKRLRRVQIIFLS
ncbi:hypothetical protein MNBD_UNCLBAC01-240 [hydrothermal vent metagenome]|uniref:Uncharacterized protein n=1 Tax=hydrothermal vent metagenome TaxID=652676 RepID=A0A3B1DGT9_9ZZZZ